MAFHALGDFQRVVRDCDHNLDLIDIVSDYALDDEVAWQFMQLYPYLRMMLARASAELGMAAGNFDEAGKAVSEGVKDLETFFAENRARERRRFAPAAAARTRALRELRTQVATAPSRARPKRCGRNWRAPSSGKLRKGGHPARPTEGAQGLGTPPGLKRIGPRRENPIERNAGAAALGLAAALALAMDAALRRAGRTRAYVGAAADGP
jgi:hypothetical protein